MPDVQYRLDAGRPQQTAEQTNRLLKVVSEIQLQFIRQGGAVAWFEKALQAFLDITGSTYGFIGNVEHVAGTTPQLHIRAAISRPVEPAAQNSHRPSPAGNSQLSNLTTLSDETLRTGQLQILNPPPQLSQGDESASDVTAIMTIPLRDDEQLIGIVGVANRPTGYNVSLAAWLEPLCTTCSTLIAASNP